MRDEIRQHMQKGSRLIDWQGLGQNRHGQALLADLTQAAGGCPDSNGLSAFASTLQVRLLHLADDRPGSVLYDCLDLDESQGRDVMSCMYSANQLRILPEVRMLGILSDEDELLAMCPASPGRVQFDVFEGSVHTVQALVKPDEFGRFCARDRQLLDRYVSLHPKPLPAPAPGPRCLDLCAVRRIWQDIILPAEKMNDLLRAMVLFAYGNVSAPSGLLLYGPPGTGKTMVAAAFAKGSGAHVMSLNVSDLKSSYIGKSGENVKRIWAEARQQQPCVMVIDEAEGIFAARGSMESDQSNTELLQAFLGEWQSEENERVLVIATTNRPELIDGAIRSRLTDEVELPSLAHAQRRPLIFAVARQIGLNGAIPDESVEQMGGLSGREVKNVLRQAMRASAPDMPELVHFELALQKVRSKGSTRVASSSSWESLVLSSETKEQLQTLCAAVKESEALEQAGIPVPRAMMLYGPPGTGKTEVARTVANEAGLTFISKTTSELKGQYLGQGAAKVAQVFEMARNAAPAILFLDEIDALTPSRDGSSDALQNEMLTEFLQQMDGAATRCGHVFVMGATNRLSAVDPAILSRFGKPLKIDLPDEGQRETLLRMLLKGRPVSCDLDLSRVAKRCEGCSGRDLRELVTSGFGHAIRRVLKEGKSAAGAVLTAIDLHRALHAQHAVN